MSNYIACGLTAKEILALSTDEFQDIFKIQFFIKN